MQFAGSGLARWSVGSGSYAFLLAFLLVIPLGAGSSAQQSEPKPTQPNPPFFSPDTQSSRNPSSTASSPSDSKPADKNKADRALSRPSLPPGIDPVQKIPLYQTIQEDWSSLTIGTSHLDPEPPLVAQTDEGNGFTRTLVQLKWRPGDPLDLYVVRPKNVKKPPAVLYLYGHKDDTDRFKDDRWCARATAGGFAAIGFVSALSGHRFHDRPMRQWFVSELQESLGSTVHDVKFILDYLGQRGDIDMKRIGMFGQSSGGAIAILAAAADARIKAVDVLDPWGDWPIWLKDSWIVADDPDHAGFTDPEFLKRVAPLDPVKWLPTLKTPRIRIQQVMDNTATPDECKDAIKNAAPKRAEVERWDHAGQFMDAAARGNLYAWIKTQLRALPESGDRKATARKTTVVTRATDPSAARSDSSKAP